MMYTPTPSARRPRPPSKTRQPLLSERPSDTRSPSADSMSSIGDTPLSAHRKRRKELSRSNLARISASPDVGDVSMDLDIKDKESGSKLRAVGLGLPSHLANRGPDHSPEAEPSPPPPYGLGQDVPQVSSGNVEAPTPLRQDSGPSSRHSSDSASIQETIVDQIKLEERLRARRAIDAARAMGLDVDFGTTTSGSEHWSMESEDDLSEGTLRARLLEMRRQLKRRDNELLLAAQVANRALETHENLMAHLPSTIKARLPDLVKLFPASRQQAQNSSGNSSSPSPPPPQHHRQPSPQPSASRSLQVTAVRSYTEEDYTTDSHNDFTTADDEPGSSKPYRISQASDTQSTRVFRPKHATHSSVSTRYVPSPRQARMTALQQEETDDRIMALEQALTDAKESEDNQRKLAARLRKEVDKLHRDFQRAEESIEEQVRPQNYGIVGTPGHREMSQGGIVIWKDHRPDHRHLAEKRARASQPRSTKLRGDERDQETFGWGSLVYPQFPPGSAKPQRRAKRTPRASEVDEESSYGSFIKSSKAMSAANSPAPSLPLSHSNSQFLDVHTPAKKLEKDSTIRLSPNNPPAVLLRKQDSNNNLTLPAESRRVRKKLSQSSFLAPETTTPDPHQRATSPAPRLTVEAPDSSSPQSNSSESRVSSKISKSGSDPRTMRRSPLPSPHGSVISGVSASSPNPRAHLEFVSRQNSLSPAFASLSSRMASMRAFVTNALNASPPVERGRTLGSELGSEYGDRPESSLRIIEDALMLAGISPSRSNTSDMEGDRSVYSDADEYSNPPAPLPPRVSAALSSLALALAPYASPVPHGSRPSTQNLQAFEYERDSSPSGNSGGSGGSGALTDDSVSSDNVTRNLFEAAYEAFALRKIKWADSTESNTVTTSTDDAEDGTASASASVDASASARGLPTDSVCSVPASSTGRPEKSPIEGLRLRLPTPPRSRPRARPSYLRYSSDGSIALAHRRRSSQQIPMLNNTSIVKSSGSPRRMSKHEEELNDRADRDVGLWEEIKDDDAWEPKTIPGRLVHDLICLMAILCDFVECAIVVIYRVIMDLRYNRRTVTGLSRRARMKRYYL